MVGQPTGAAGTAATAALTAGGMQVLTSTNSPMYDLTSGVIYNVRAQSVAAPPGGGVNTARESMHIFDFNLVPRAVFVGGPGYGTSNDYDRFNGSFSHQLFASLVVEVAYNRELVENLARNTIEGVGNRIQVDPNAYLPDGALNPHAGEFYTENYVVLRHRDASNDDIRFSASYDFEPARKFGFLEHWVGRQRLAGMFHSRRAGTIENQQEEVLVQNPYATTSPDEGNGNLNRLRRRTYRGTTIAAQAGLGDYRSHPVNGLLNRSTGLPVSTMFVPFGQTRDTFRRTDSRLLVWQGGLWQDHLVATVGYRDDRLMTIQPNTTVRAAPFAPFAQGILVPARGTGKTRSGGITRNQGLVAKPLPWLSLFYNRSSSFDTPAATVRIFNDSPAPSSQGLTEDYGLKFALLQGRLFATVTRYETSANDQAGNGGVQTYLTALNSIWDTLEAAGVAEAAGVTVFANGRTYDRKSTGWEYEMTANLTANWRLMLNYSANKTIQSDEGKEIMDCVAQLTPLFTASGRGNLPLASGAGQVTIAQQLAAMQEDFQEQYLNPNGGRQPGQPVAQGNLRTTYSFREGRLRGVSAGGGARWRGARVIGFSSDDPQFRREIRGEPTVTVDANVSYRRKVGLFGRQYDVTFQLNVNNLLDDDDLIITRVFTDASPRTFSTPAPRQWFLTTTVLL